MCTSTVIWSIWKLRNSLCFQGGVWSDVKVVLIKVARMLRRWKVLCKEAENVWLEEVVEALQQKARENPRIGWLPASLGGMDQAASSSTFGAVLVSSENANVDVFPAVSNL